MKSLFILASLFFLGLASSANASLIDFRSSDFSGANNQASFTYGDLTIEALPYIDGNDYAVLYQDSYDGIGVKYDYENDEVEGVEYLHLSFNTTQLLNEILITDLFNEPFNDGQGSYLEEGLYSFDNSSWTSFYADEYQTPSTNGELSLLFSSLLITDIWFSAPGYMENGSEDHEFSVAGIDVSPVPEPATIFLFGSGLIGLAGFRRKYSKK